MVTLFMGLLCNNAFAKYDGDEDDSYGIIDAIYPEESRIVIGDRSINFDSRSRFNGEQGETIIDMKVSRIIGSYAKFHVTPTGKESLFLIDLTLISESEFNQSQEQGRDDEY